MAEGREKEMKYTVPGITHAQTSLSLVANSLRLLTLNDFKDSCYCLLPAACSHHFLILKLGLAYSARFCHCLTTGSQQPTVSETAMKIAICKSPIPSS